MKVTKMSVGIGVTVNLGNYENLKADAMVEAELESHDSIERVEALLNERARHAVADQLADYALEAASNYGLDSFHSEASVAGLLKRSATYKFIRNLDPEVADNTMNLLIEEWQQAQPVELEELIQPADVIGASSEPTVTLADLEATAEVVTAQLDEMLDEAAEPTPFETPDSEYFGDEDDDDDDYDEDDGDDDEDDYDDYDEDDDQPEHDTEVDYDDDVDDLNDEDEDLDYDYESLQPSFGERGEPMELDAHDDLAIAEAEAESTYQDEATEPDTQVAEV